jgi:hypothetical protein
VQKVWRYVPLTSVVGDDRYCLFVIARQHTLDPGPSLRLEGDTVTDLELKHLDVRPRLIEKAQALDNPMVEVDEFGFGQFVESIFISPLLSASGDLPRGAKPNPRA